MNHSQQSSTDLLYFGTESRAQAGGTPEHLVVATGEDGSQIVILRTTSAAAADQVSAAFQKVLHALEKSQVAQHITMVSVGMAKVAQEAEDEIAEMLAAPALTRGQLDTFH